MGLVGQLHVKNEGAVCSGAISDKLITEFGRHACKARAGVGRLGSMGGRVSLA